MHDDVATAYIGVGSNIAPYDNVPDALIRLAAKVPVTAVSSCYWTAPVDGSSQPPYLNVVWEVRTSHDPSVLKHTLLYEIERALDRRRSTDHYAPRSIDLDLLLHGTHVIHDDHMVLPHPDIYHRPFVAVPLYELNNDLILPDTGDSIREVIDRMTGCELLPDQAFTMILRELIHA